jgi:hypothetical protein
MSGEQSSGSDNLQRDIEDVLDKIEDLESHPRSSRGPNWVRRVWSGIWQGGASRLRRRLVPRMRSGKSRPGGEFSTRGGYWRGRYITYDDESRRGLRGWLRRRRR